MRRLKASWSAEETAGGYRVVGSRLLLQPVAKAPGLLGYRC